MRRQRRGAGKTAQRLRERIATLFGVRPDIVILTISDGFWSHKVADVVRWEASFTCRGAGDKQGTPDASTAEVANAERFTASITSWETVTACARGITVESERRSSDGMRLGGMFEASDVKPDR